MCMSVEVCVCVPACTCGCVGMYHVPLFLPLLFFVWKTAPNKQRTAQSSTLASTPVCWCIANIYLPETAGSSRRLSKRTAQEKRCVYICDYRFDLSPYAGPFVIQTKGGALRFATHLLRVKRVALDSSKHLATLEVTCFPLREVYFHRDIFP